MKVPSETTGIIPRWEWRMFAPTLPVAPALVETLGGVPEKAHRETYLLSLNSEHNVKIRDETLDVKRLERTDAETGLEQWRPVAKAAFPVSATVVAVACSAWGIPAPPPDRRVYSQVRLLRDVVARNPNLRAVAILKQRTRFTLLECAAERADLDIGGRRLVTLAFEDEDPGRVLACVRQLRLESNANANYPKALKRILGLMHVAGPFIPEVV